MNETRGMEISKEEAAAVVKLADISWDEGLGADNDAELIERIFTVYPDLETDHMRWWLDHFNEVAK